MRSHTRLYLAKLKLCYLKSHGHLATLKLCYLKSHGHLATLKLCYLKSLCSLVLAVAVTTTVASAASASVADLDARSRASGNRIDIAMAVGERLFTRTWPAQVLQIVANEMGTHLVLGMRVSGVKFHSPLTREAFDREIVDLVTQGFTSAPAAEEIDVWATVPLDVGKGLVVSGDLAKPTTRTVFTISVRRTESPAALAARLRSGTSVFLDEEWARAAFAKD